MTLTLTATPFSFESPPRVQLNITSTNTAPNAVDPFAHFTIKRTDADGRSRNVIMAPDPLLTSGVWSGNDFHAPNNQPVTYTVYTGSLSASSAQVKVTAPGSWMMHRSNPTLAVKVDSVSEIGDRTSPSTAAIHWVVNAEYPVAKNQGVRRARSGQLVIECESPDNEAAVRELLHDSGVVLLNLETSAGGWWDEKWAWIQPLDVVQSNPAGWLYFTSRTITFPYQVVDTPAAAIIPLWTYEMLAAEFGHYPDLPPAFGSYADMAANHRTV